MDERSESAGPDHFIAQRIRKDQAQGKHGGAVVTRFPPEPNGYLHLGHAKSICLNFGMAEVFAGHCNLRLDDTNPAKESSHYAEAIERDVTWLGFSFGAGPLHASDYFERIYECAEALIAKGLAYVDSQDQEAIRAQRGTLTEPGSESPFRNRSIEENLALFRAMRAGDFEDGAHVLRAKIDMGSPNLNLRDPVLYRIRRMAHQRTGDAWCIYPMYDYTHCLSDAFESITHSLCTLEFEDHRPLYDWVLDQFSWEVRPQQIEFSRLELEYTVLSKRHLNALVTEGHVEGWDDPRMPTISGLRRRGYTPKSIRAFADSIGVAKRENLIDVAHLEYCVREDLNKTTNRVMGVLDPILLVLDNYPEGQTEWLTAENNPEDPESGHREIPFSKHLWIERSDFKEEANRKFFRLTLGKEVRLKNGYIIKGESVVKNTSGEITQIHATYDPLSKSGSNNPEASRKVKGTIHWVSKDHALDAEVRLYDRLFTSAAPDADKEGDFIDHLNPNSLEVITAKVEPGLKHLPVGTPVQFQRTGYFVLDPESTAEALVFNRTVTLRDSWGKLEQK